MKTTLLKKEHILALLIFVSFSTKAIYAQGESSGDSSSSPEIMQRMSIEFINVDGPEVRRELQLGFSEYTSDEFDEDYDTKNLEVSQNDLNLTLNGDPMTEQAYGPITEDKVVPLLLNSSGSYTFAISISSTENMSGQNVHLRDNITGDVFNLVTGGTYQFTTEEGVFPNRFELLFKTQSETLSQTDYKIEGLDVRYALNANKLVVSNTMNKEISSLVVYNIFGQSVYNNSNIGQQNSTTIQLSNLSTGAYIVQLITEDNGILTKKILVK